MQTSTKQLLTIMKIITWVIFIGLCIKTGALLTSFFVSLFINAEGSKNLYLGLDLSALYGFNQRHYIAIGSLIILNMGLKAFIFYLVLSVFLKTNFVQPFSPKVAELITKIAVVTIITGVLAVLANGYSDWLYKRGVPVDQHWGSAEFLFMGGILFVIALIFKRGIEIQSENDLTI